MGVRWHCIPLPMNTASGLPIYKWFARALRRKVEAERKVKGWFFSDGRGKRRRMGYYDALLTEYLTLAQIHFPAEVGETAVIEDFSLWRSGRRGATTEARNHNVDEGVITLMGRWRKREKARGSEPGLPMSQVYTQVKNSVPAMLTFASKF